MMTIKEVHDQLTKEELGTEKARIKGYKGEGAIICGMENDTWIVVRQDLDDKFDGWPVHLEVEWIGNQPKTKKLYKAMICQTLDCYVENWVTKEFILDLKTSEIKEWGRLLSYLLPEDQYSPIEVDE